MAGGGVSLGWTGRSAVGCVAKIRNRERGRKWAKQEEIDMEGEEGRGRVKFNKTVLILIGVLES